MRTQESGNHLERCRLFDALDDAQHLQFVSGVQTVSTLDFYAPRSFSDDFVYTTHRLLVQFVFGHVVQFVGRIEDATAPFGDFGIAQATYLVHKLLLTTPCKDNVCVRIAPRGQHTSAFGIYLLYIRRKVAFR